MFKKFLETKGVSESDFNAMDAVEVAKLQNEYNDVKAKEIEELKTQISKAGTAEEIKAVSEKLNSFVDASKNVSDEAVKLQEVVKTQGIELAKLKENNSVKENLSFGEAVKNALTEKHDELKNWIEEKKVGGWFDIEVKAAAPVLTTTNFTTATAPGNFGAINADTYSPYTREQIFVESYLDSATTDKPSLPFVNETAGEGDAAIVAEGSLKPLIDADYNVTYSEAKKVAGRMKASEEALFDFKWLQGAMTTTLRRKHDIARQRAILTGDGSSLTGITQLATPFNAAMTASIAGTTVNPQLYDAVAAVAAAVEVESEGAFVPNVAFINTLDALKMKLTKNADGDYILPPFIASNGKVIDGIMVVAKPNITVGTFVIGDLKNVKMREVWGYTVRIGRDGNDFSENMLTMVGESRLHLYCTDNDKRGIITGTFADVILAI